MKGTTELKELIRTMSPRLNEGTYVFCSVRDAGMVNLNEVVGMFHEQEGITVILEQGIADRLQLPYSFVAAWITLSVHSALEAVGLTAAFSNALAAAGISCNVVAGYYHDHIFVAAGDADKAMAVLQELSKAGPNDRSKIEAG